MTDRDLPTPRDGQTAPAPLLRRITNRDQTCRPTSGRGVTFPLHAFAPPKDETTPAEPPEAPNPSAPILRFIGYGGGYPILQFTFSSVLSDPAPSRRGDVG